MPRAKTKRKPRTTRKPRYKPVLKLPPLPPDQFEALRQNISVHGVLQPIVVDSDGPRRRIIDGSHRKKIADDLGYECPEIVQEGDEEELRILARALNLARRQLDREQKRELIADQLRETPDRTNRWIAKMLGVGHPTVASVRSEMEAVGTLFQQGRRVGSDGKSYMASKGREYWPKRKGNHDNPLDFHPTPEHVVESLLARERFCGTILEPASGDGAIVKVLRKAGYTVKGTDITSGQDFLKRTRAVPNIVTNPPYADGMAEKFCRHALAITKSKVAMLLPMWCLEGVQRHDLFSEQPLKAIYIFSRRLTFGKHQECHAPLGTFWAVWHKNYRGKPHIEWILD